METSFKQTTSNKVERYRLFLPQFELLISDEKEEISVLANTAAALREAFGFFWVGFYLVKDDQLILGPPRTYSLQFSFPLRNCCSYSC